jgi:hypothetical protein
MVTLVKRTNQKNHVNFMPHAFNKIERPLVNVNTFNQIEPFEKL